MAETPEQLITKLRQDAWDYSLNSFGYAYIFDLKAGKYSRYTNWLKVLGIIVPVTIGATATGYGLDSEILKAMIWVSIPVSIIQLAISVIAVVYKWDDELTYAIEASQDLATMSTAFKKLAQFPSNDFQEYKCSSELLAERYNARARQNTKHDVTEKELRKGMRWALRQFQRPCAGCNKVPSSMEPTNCPVCGNF